MRNGVGLLIFNRFHVPFSLLLCLHNQNGFFFTIFRSVVRANNNKATLRLTMTWSRHNAQLFSCSFHRSCDGWWLGSMEVFEPKVRSHEILQNLCAKVNDSSFMNVLWVIRVGGEHCCVRAFGVIRIQKDFHEDITPRGIHNQALHKSDKPSFSALQWNFCLVACKALQHTAPW